MIHLKDFISILKKVYVYFSFGVISLFFKLLLFEKTHNFKIAFGFYKNKKPIKIEILMGF